MEREVILWSHLGRPVTFERGGGIDSRELDSRGAPVRQAVTSTRNYGTSGDCGAWERFVEVDEGDGWVSLRCGEFYLTAEEGGGGYVSTNRTAVGAWEKWKKEAGGYQAVDGFHWLCVEADGRVNCSRPQRGSWETFENHGPHEDPRPVPPDVPQPVERRRGNVRGVGRLFVDEGGAYNPTGFSFFWAIWGMKHDRDRTLRNMDYMMERQAFDEARLFGQVKGASWADRVIDPADIGYEDVVAETIDELWDRGMRSNISVIADGEGINPMQAAQKIRNVIKDGRREKVSALVAANEDNMTQPEEVHLQEVVEYLKREFPDLPIAARSAPMPDRDAYLDYATMFSLHGDRTPPAERQVRQPWDAIGVDEPGTQDEPAGPWSSIAEQWEPIVLAMQAANGRLCGLGRFVYHQGPGIRGGGAWNGYIPANFWEIPNGIAQMNAIRASSRLMPGDVAQWRKYNGHWISAPLGPTPMASRWIWSDGFPEGVSRIYSASQGDQFVSLPIAVKGAAPMYFARDVEIRVCDPTDETRTIFGGRVRGGALRFEDVGSGRQIIGAGDPLVLTGPDKGGLWGYIVRGQYV